MSVPHTGRLLAMVDGSECRFDGDLWTSPDAPLAARLNAIRADSAFHHYDIRSLAVRIFHLAGLDGRWQILECEGDTWPDELLPGEID